MNPAYGAPKGLPTMAGDGGSDSFLILSLYLVTGEWRHREKLTAHPKLWISRSKLHLPHRAQDTINNMPGEESEQEL